MLDPTANPGDRRITAIEPVESREGEGVVSVAVRVGRRRVATLAVKLAAELGLRVGQVWDDALAERVAGARVSERAFKAAMKMLNRRAASRRQVELKLQKAGFERPVIAAALERLERIGAVDDLTMGRELVRQILARKPAGVRLLGVKLGQKGLSRKVVDQVLGELAPSDEDALAAAMKLARARLPRLAGLEPAVRKRRLWGLLARRGFESEVIERAMRRVGSDEDGE
ncbi:MAG: regulatory protein RecX [Phycisphaeraceae bacterium]|nr:regulatory protein RecX [Phycisphaeraceae bacterium]